VVSQESLQDCKSITVFDGEILNSGCQLRVLRRSLKLIRCTLFVLAATKKVVAPNIRVSVSVCTNDVTSGSHNFIKNKIYIAV
jgi:hypothetical protein